MLHIFEPILEEPSEQTQEEGKENPILIHGACGTLADEKRGNRHYGQINKRLCGFYEWNCKGFSERTLTGQ